MGEKKVIRSTCKSCHGGCGVLVTVQDGAIINITGDEETVTLGTCAQRGNPAYSMLTIRVVSSTP